jgi:hypothetical protein
MSAYFRIPAFGAVLATTFVLFSVQIPAQMASGTIYGRIVDQQGGAIPGVTVLATHVEAGHSHEASTDGSGTYRLLLPIGTYRVTTSLPGFERTESLVTVNVATNVPLDLKLAIETFKDAVVVDAQVPRVSSREEVVDLGRVEGLPLNGRQLADIAATLPGVGLGNHSDPSKSGQHAPQVNGGNGRNINTLVDGGDNNDDTVGGLLQLFPLEAIQEFKLIANRGDAEYSRGGAVMNIATKSGTNAVRGSWFGLFRHDALNARTFSEQRANLDKQPYQRDQYGGSLGGPLVRSRAHYFAAYERTQRDTRQVVDTGNVLPGDGAYDVPYRQDLFFGKVTSAINRAQYLSIRYAREKSTQPSGVASNAAFSTWATSANTYHSVNVNHNWSIGRASLNEIVFQFSNYENDTTANVTGPSVILAGGALFGANLSAPQRTEQRRWQFRNDYSWTAGGAGLSHEFRAGASLVRTPRLFVWNESGTLGFLNMRSNDIEGGVAAIMLIGGTVSSNIPLDLYGLYLQDDWRVTDRLTVNLGVRWDYLDGMPIEQTSTNFQNMQLAGQTGRFDGTLLEDFGKEPRGDWDNIQPRLGAVYDLGGNGRNLVRGGWGIYTDIAYTNANVLTTSLEGGGIVLSAACVNSSAASAFCDPTRGFIIPDSGGQLFNYRDSISVLGLPLMTPTTGEVVSPRLEQPFTYQTNLGWSHQMNTATSFTVDYVRADGRDLNMRVRPNVFVSPGVRYLAGVGVSPNSHAFRTALSKGSSRYDALIVAARRQMSRGFDLNASYTLGKATSDVGTSYDELTQNLLQDINDPFGPFQQGPSTRVDARHRATISTIVQVPYGIRVASVFSYRSALPATTLDGRDLNGDGVANDHTERAYRYTGLNADGTARFEDMGACQTVNCSRRAPFSQMNLRVSRSFRLMGSARIEAIGEVFNVFNAKNPFIPNSTTHLNGSGTQQLTTFMQPTAFAGDTGQGEQRIAQFGARFTF